MSKDKTPADNSVNIIEIDKVKDKLKNIRKERKAEELQKSFHKAMGWGKKKWPTVKKKSSKKKDKKNKKNK